jgi:hypothetical protein
MNILFDLFIKGGSKLIVDTIAKLLSLLMSERMIAIFIIDLAEAMSKRTKNTFDDKAVKLWKEQIENSGIKLS